MSIVFVVSAPSGSGKSTLIGRLLRSVERLSFSTSYTTRPLRGREVSGESYHFISREDFQARIERGEFLEYAEVFGNYYGTHQSTLTHAERLGHDLVLDIDVQGARKLRTKVSDLVSIFVLPPSRQVLEERLSRRSEDSQEVIERRLREAVREVRDCSEYDYLLINRNLEESVLHLCSIVRAERVRRQRVESEIEPILETFCSTTKV